MALQKLTGGENTAQQVRDKINAAITEVDAVSDAATALGVNKAELSLVNNAIAELHTKAPQSNLDTTNLVLGTKADSATLDALGTTVDAQRYEYTDVKGRPGDSPGRFSLIALIAQASGNGRSFSQIPQDNIAFGDDGTVARLNGSGIVVARAAQPLEVGRMYLLRWVVRRRANPSDPSNDSVQNIIVWLDQARNVLPGADGVTVVRSYDTLLTASGRQEFTTTISRSGNVGATITAPAGARYARIGDQLFGLDGVTDVEVLATTEVTDAVLLDTVSADAISRIGALESANAAARIQVLETGQNAPNSVTYATVSDATAAHVPTSATTIETRGEIQAGDGGGGLFRRIAGPLPAGSTGFTSADGGIWQFVNAFTGISPTRAQFGLWVIPAVVVALTLAGHSVAGDLGRRAPYKAGTSSGPYAIQDAKGRWFEIDTVQGVCPGWFGAKGDTSTDDTPAFTAAAAAVAPTAGTIRLTQTLINTFFNVGLFTLPSGVDLVNESGNSGILRRYSGAAVYGIRAMGNNRIIGVTYNGNNLVSEGIQIAGQRVTLQDVTIDYCYQGIYNGNSDQQYYENVYVSQCQYAYYSANRGIIVNFINFQAYACVFGIEFTYTATGTSSDQQPQTVRVYASIFEMVNYPIHTTKDIYDLVVRDTSFDACLADSITLGCNPTVPGVGQADIRIEDCYFGTANRGIIVAAGYNRVAITGNGINDGVNGLIILQGTSTLRSRGVYIGHNGFGQCGHASIDAESVVNLKIEDNSFQYAFAAPMNAPYDIIVGSAYAGTPPAKVYDNDFLKDHPMSPGSNAVCKGNINFKTDFFGHTTFNGLVSLAASMAHGMHPDAPPVCAEPGVFNGDPNGYYWAVYDGSVCSVQSKGVPANQVGATVRLKSVWSE